MVVILENHSATTQKVKYKVILYMYSMFIE